LHYIHRNCFRGEIFGGDHPANRAAAIRAMLQNWNGLQVLTCRPPSLLTAPSSQCMKSSKFQKLIRHRENYRGCSTNAVRGTPIERSAVSCCCCSPCPADARRKSDKSG